MHLYDGTPGRGASRRLRNNVPSYIRIIRIIIRIVISYAGRGAPRGLRLHVPQHALLQDDTKRQTEHRRDGARVRGDYNRDLARVSARVM